MKVVILVVGIILVGCYVGNYPVLNRMYPKNATDYDQFILFYNLRNKVYELMFCLLFYVSMVQSTKLIRAIFAFGFVMCAASCFDKLILNISQYLVTDVLVVVAALGASVYGYKREKNARQD